MPGYWTTEAREAARQRILKHKPWVQSTGPKTEQGKTIASRNAMTFVNQVKEGMWCYLPKHKVFARQDTVKGKELVELYQRNHSFYGDRSFLINGINRYGDRWLDELI